MLCIPTKDTAPGGHDLCLLMVMGYLCKRSCAAGSANVRTDDMTKVK